MPYVAVIPKQQLPATPPPAAEAARLLHGLRIRGLAHKKTQYRSLQQQPSAAACSSSRRRSKSVVGFSALVVTLRTLRMEKDVIQKGKGAKTSFTP